MAPTNQAWPSKVASLKSAVGDRPLYVSRDGLGLNRDEVWCDVTELESAVAQLAHHAHRDLP